MRSLEDIQRSMIAALAAANSPVDDLSPGSVLNTLIRSASVTVLEQENKLDELKLHLNPLTATGTYLDDYARSTYNLRRKPGTLARGYVILSTTADSLTVSKGTILTHLATGLQFITTDEVTVTNTFDTYTQVYATTRGETANLNAGTPLYSDTYPQITFTVGLEKRPDGSYCGALTGGKLQENDREFRERISEIRSNQGPTLSSVLNAYLPIDRAWITTLSPGFVQVYIDTPSELTPEFEEELRGLVQDFLAPGTYIVFTKVTSKPIDLDIQVVMYSNTNPDSDIRNALTDYFESLEPGQLLYPAAIASIIKPFVYAVSVVTPNQPVLLKPGELPQLSDISICYV